MKSFCKAVGAIMMAIMVLKLIQVFVDYLYGTYGKKYIVSEIEE